MSVGGVQFRRHCRISNVSAERLCVLPEHQLLTALGDRYRKHKIELWGTGCSELAATFRTAFFGRIIELIEQLQRGGMDSAPGVTAAEKARKCSPPR